MRVKLIISTLCAAAAAFAVSPLLQAPPQAAAKTNPYGGNARAARAGGKLYDRHCAACHGREGEGIGKRPPLATKAVSDAPPGAVEWVIRNGSMGGGMPSFSSLPEAQRWQIVTYVKSLSEPRPRP